MEPTTSEVEMTTDQTEMTRQETEGQGISEQVCASSSSYEEGQIDNPIKDPSDTTQPHIAFEQDPNDLTEMKKQQNPVHSGSGRSRKDSIVIAPDKATEGVQADDIDQSPITRVVMLAIDSSKYAEYALEWSAKNFISPATDLVVLVNVRDIPPAPTYGSTIAIDYGFLIAGLDEQYRTASHALLKTAAAKLRNINKKLAVKAISIRGEPREELIRKAAEIQADVIIVASQGKGFVKRTILGSTTDFIVHHSKCTVLVVKMPDPE